jgi:hypothetical protein
MKISEELSSKIGELYTKYRSLNYTKTEARSKVAIELNVGKTTVFDHTQGKELEVEIQGKPLSVKTPSTIILTSWEIRIGIDWDFVRTLEVMAKEYNAELVLVPCNVSDVAFLPQEIKDKFSILVRDTKFNDNLQLKFVETSALTQSPLAGHVGAYPDFSTIIPGLVKELRTEPSNKYVKQLMSTGSLGYLDAKYTDYEVEDSEFTKKWRNVVTRRHGKPTAIAKNYIQPSALIIDVLDKKVFLSRFITSKHNGVVYDLNKKFTPNGVTKHQPSALVTGDFHAFNADDVSTKGTKDMIRTLDPKEVILNDFFDGASVNYHESGDAATFSKAPSIREEVEVTTKLLDDICRISNKVTYLHSNHDDFIMKLINRGETAWRFNNNYKDLCELQLFRLEETQHPIVKLLNLESYKNLQFVNDLENYVIDGVLIKHGHEGAGGARLGFWALAKIYNYYVQAHLHSPAVFRNAVCVGTNSKMNLGYNKGASAWLAANSIIHPDGSQQLLPIIYGEWIR